MAGTVKTTLELPDDLLKEIRLRAVHENRRIKDVVADALRRGLATTEPGAAIRHKVKLPLIDSHPAAPGDEMTPDRIAEILIDQDAQWALEVAAARESG